MSMSFELTLEQKKWLELAREFAIKEAAPRAAEIDDTNELPLDLFRKMAAPPYQFTAVPAPKEDGGLGLGVVTTCVINEELASACPVLVVLMELAHQAPIWLNRVRKELKEKFLPVIIRGEGTGAFALTEPHTGSDPSALRSTARLDGDQWVLNGRKRYVSFAGTSLYTIVIAKTDVGVSAFLVERGTPGFEVIEKIPTLGVRGHQDEEVLLKDCRIPKENLIGEEGKGLKLALATLNETRTTLCAGFIGLARAAFEAAVSYAKQRQSFGQKLSEHQALRFPMAEVATDIEAARLLTYKAAWLIDNGQPHSKETSMAKHFAAQTVIKATDLAMKVHGGFGCTKRFPVERYLRDARTWVYAQGSPEMMKEIVARYLLA